MAEKWKYVNIFEGGRVTRSYKYNPNALDKAFVPPRIWRRTDSEIRAYFDKVYTIMGILKDGNLGG